MIKSYKFCFLLMLALVLVLSSCKKDEPENEIPDVIKNNMTILVYAVVADLDIDSDKLEMLQAGADIDLTKNRLLVYEVKRTGDPKLSEMAKDKEGKVVFRDIKVYDRELYSTDPRRISAVIEDVMELRPAKEYGLIFWSHGTGWSPNFSNHGESVGSRSASDSDVAESQLSIETAQDSFEVINKDFPLMYSFGSDKDIERDPSYTDYTDIDELADAIPDDTFNFIWFDVCYMGGIETVYQLRNKCEYFIGMPTEDAGNGMPYQLTIPYLLKENPDCVAAAKEFFTYYETGQDSSWAVATVGVCKMSEIEPVADYCRRAYLGASKPSSSGLQVYSRYKNGPFYDFGQYTRRMADSNSLAPENKEFEAAMNDFVIYKAATETDFAGRYIDQENYSGLSCHLYDPNDTGQKNVYYRSLDWFKRVYE